MSDDLADFWVHTGSLQTKTGTSSSGKSILATPVDVPGFYEAKRRYVRDSTGQQVISEATYYAARPFADQFTPGSVFTPPGEKQTTVIERSVFDSGDLDLPDHVQVSLL